MKMIVLCGSSDTGKTTTLFELVSALIARGATLASPAAMTRVPVDYYRLSYLGQTILIATDGDDQKRIAKNFAQVTPTTDVFIMASRAKNGSRMLEQIEQFAKSHKTVTFYVAALAVGVIPQLQIRQARIDQIVRLV